ncbi:hypothetical protein COCMIDRAFT_32926 [Bipolaris oryzae ATCC 44560]|uniref:Uncharacterized protein n=1 Tax=Bipolaris oryzae ATCC 44560 TaxID=930090 RepID=W6ZQE0_COCMI|nr:uncharacterized protein COCMIDRAFT_32926 [Bipolaris oryzae ATCC 44560]EUC49709.1 hypothetical protein COCMIDRAFT_32926 [Bipolaris oryzae ATCC 44560]
MIATTKYHRISKNLESLPCELHEDILIHLQFHQLIRLSSCAGPRLIWSLQHSLSSWHRYFSSPAAITSLQELLAITDTVAKHGFPPSRKHVDATTIYEQEWSLRFLKYKASEWGSDYSVVELRNLQTTEALTKHWLNHLSRMVTSVLGPIVPNDPSFPQLPASFPTPASLVSFLASYQRAREANAEALARQLEHLALLYEAHPTRFKMPFDPRSSPPSTLNATHIPSTMRSQARRIVNVARAGKWRRHKRFLHRFAWPGLVPYESCVQLFNGFVLRTGLLKGGKVEGAGELMEECRSVIEGRPVWAGDVRKGKEVEGKSEGDAIEELSSMMERQNLGADVTPIRIQVYIEDAKEDIRKVLVVPRAEMELQWLERFAQVTASLEQAYPDLEKDSLGPVPA